MAHKFVIKKDRKGEFRVNFVYNSETIFQTEGYDTRAGAKRAIESIQKHVPGAPTDDQSDD